MDNKLFKFVCTYNLKRNSLQISYSIQFVGRLDTWNITWLEVEELRFEIEAYNMDVKLWEYFSNLERQNAIDIPGDDEVQVDNLVDFID